MFTIRVDITGKDYLTKSYDTGLIFDSIKEARETAASIRNGLYDDYCNYEIRDYSVDITHYNG